MVVPDVGVANEGKSLDLNRQVGLGHDEDKLAASKLETEWLFQSNHKQGSIFPFNGQPP